MPLSFVQGRGADAKEGFDDDGGGGGGAARTFRDVVPAATIGGVPMDSAMGGDIMPMQYDFDGIGDLPSPTALQNAALALDNSLAFPHLDAESGGLDPLSSPTALALGLSFTSVELLNALESDLPPIE